MDGKSISRTTEADLKKNCVPHSVANAESLNNITWTLLQETAFFVCSYYSGIVMQSCFFLFFFYHCYRFIASGALIQCRVKAISPYFVTRTSC